MLTVLSETGQVWEKFVCTAGIHPVSKVLVQVARCSTDIGLPNCLLYAAAVHEHILLPGMTVVVAKHLCIHTHAHTYTEKKYIE